MFQAPRSRVASARTATVMVCVPALPPWLATIGASTASATIFSSWCSKPFSTEEARNAVRRLTNSQPKRLRAISQTLAESSSCGPHAAERLDVGVGLGLDHVDDVVDHDDADEPVGLVDDRGRDEVVALEHARHVLLVVHRPDDVGLAAHDLFDRHGPLRAQEPVERHGADEVVARIDHEDFVERVGKVFVSRAGRRSSGRRSRTPARR